VLTGDFFAPYFRRPHERGSWQPKGLSEGFFTQVPTELLSVISSVDIAEVEKFFAKQTIFTSIKNIVPLQT
jgi:hypothetical protein